MGKEIIKGLLIGAGAAAVTVGSFCLGAAYENTKWAKEFGPFLNLTQNFLDVQKQFMDELKNELEEGDEE